MPHSLLFFSVFAVAAILHGVTGIGFPILTTAALTLFLPLKAAIVISLFPTLVINGLSFLSGNRPMEVVKSNGALAASSIVGSLLGVQMLFWVNEGVLLLLLVAAVVLYVYASLFGKLTHLVPSLPKTIGYGTVAGLIGGPTNAMSPVVMMYLLSTSEDKNTISQSANLCFLLGKLSQLVVLLSYGEAIFEPKLLTFTLAVTGLSVACLYGGFALRERISVVLFKRIVLVALTLLGASLAAKALLRFLH